MRSAFFLTLAAVTILTASQASAQLMRHRPPAHSDAPMQVDCDMVAANPDAGMDKASCEALNQAQAAYTAAKNDPSGARPGDEALSCQDIKAEFMTQPVSAPSAEHVARAQAATTDFMAKESVVQKEAGALAAKETAENVAASAAGMANPLAGRAADTALEAEHSAEQAALNAQAQAMMTPAEHAVTSSTAAVVGDITPQVQSNPRIAHLMELANAKHCHGF